MAEPPQPPKGDQAAWKSMPTGVPLIGSSSTPASIGGPLGGLGASFADATSQAEQLYVAMERLKKLTQELSTASGNGLFRGIGGGSTSDWGAKVSNMGKAARDDHNAHQKGIATERKVANGGDATFGDEPEGNGKRKGLFNFRREGGPPRGSRNFGDSYIAYSVGSAVVGGVGSWYQRVGEEGLAHRMQTARMGGGWGMSATAVEHAFGRNFRANGGVALNGQDYTQGITTGLDTLGMGNRGGGYGGMAMMLNRAMPEMGYAGATAAAGSLMSAANLTRMGQYGIIKNRQDAANPQTMVRNALNWAGNGKFTKEMLNSAENSAFRFNLRKAVGAENEMAVLRAGQSMLGGGSLNDKNLREILGTKTHEVTRESMFNEKALDVMNKQREILEGIKTWLEDTFGKGAAVAGALSSLPMASVFAGAVGGGLMSRGAGTIGGILGPLKEAVKGTVGKATAEGITGAAKARAVTGAIATLFGTGLTAATALWYGSKGTEAMRNSDNRLAQSLGTTLERTVTGLGGMGQVRRWVDRTWDSFTGAADSVGGGPGAGEGDPPSRDPGGGIRTAPGWSAHGNSEHITGLQPSFRQKLAAMFAANPKLQLRSGYRSVERQRKLWEDAVKKYGSEAAARKWVAPPGKSYHNKGLAADIGPNSEYGWIRANASRFGLTVPLSNEDWHVEPIGARSGRSAVETNIDNNPGNTLGAEWRSQGEDGGAPGIAGLDGVRGLLARMSTQSGDSALLSALAGGVSGLLGNSGGRRGGGPSDASGSQDPSQVMAAAGDASDIEKFLLGLRMTESGGKNIRNRGGHSSASGYYQYVKGTWGGYGGYAEAIQAPFAVQHERARKDAMAAFEKYGNWAAVAANHIYPAWAGQPSKWGQSPAPGNPPVQEYVNKVLGAAGLGEGDPPTRADGGVAGSGVGGPTSLYQGGSRVVNLNVYAAQASDANAIVAKVIKALRDQEQFDVIGAQ